MRKLFTRAVWSTVPFWCYIQHGGSNTELKIFLFTTKPKLSYKLGLCLSAKILYLCRNFFKYGKDTNKIWNSARIELFFQLFDDYVPKDSKVRMVDRIIRVVWTSTLSMDTLWWDWCLLIPSEDASKFSCFSYQWRLFLSWYSGRT